MNAEKKTDFHIVNHSLPRRDGRVKVTGKAQYVANAGLSNAWLYRARPIALSARRRATGSILRRDGKRPGRTEPLLWPRS